jgi:hypothetical protein
MVQHTTPERAASAQAALADLGVLLEPPLPLFLLAGLAAERPVLLMGVPGQAKTQLALALGRALAGGRTRVLNAALTAFDDVRGFIRPASLDAGRVEIVPGPWSPYDDLLLFVDELSRAPHHEQNRWLQLLHERLVDGQPTSLRWVLSAMNPPGDGGAHPLQLATADRFLAILRFTPFERLPPAARLRIAAGNLASPDHAAHARLAAHVEAIAARAAALRESPHLVLRLAQVSLAAIDAFGIDGQPFVPQGRRAALLTELSLHVLAALALETPEAELSRAFSSHLDAIVLAGLSSLAEATGAPPDLRRAAHDRAVGQAGRALSLPALAPDLAEVPTPLPPARPPDEVAAHRRRLVSEMARTDVIPAERTASVLELWSAIALAEARRSV